MRILISTGEVSGDLQGSMLIASLYKQASLLGLNLEIYGLGGQRMSQAGAKILADTTVISSIGLWEAIPFILPTFRSQNILKKYIKDYPPDLVILIDYVGPNLVIGSYINQHYPEIPIFYYIAPQSWIWDPRPQDTKRLVSLTDHMLAIFPKEAQFFQEQGLSVSWVGHPLLDRIQSAPSRESARESLEIKENEIVVSIFPASRKQELKYLLPVISQACTLLQKQSTNIRFFFALSLLRYREKIESEIAKYGLNAIAFQGDTLQLMAASDLAIAKSGTVNLELALLNIPQVVVYRLSPLTMLIARKILKFSVSYLAPSNIVLNREISPELIQENATAERIFQESLDLIFNPERRQSTFDGYQEMRKELGDIGVCERSAQEIFARLQKIY